MHDILRLARAILAIPTAAAVCLGAVVCHAAEARATASRRDRSVEVSTVETATDETATDEHPATPPEARRDLALQLTIEQDGRQAPAQTLDQDGHACTAVEVPIGGEVKLTSNGEHNWTDAARLVFLAKLDDAPGVPVQFVFFFQNVDFWWYQKLLRAEVMGDGWTTITVPLEPEPLDAGTKYAWQGIGHAKPYDGSALRKMRSVGVIIIPDAKRTSATGPVRVLLADAHLEIDSDPIDEAPRFYDLVSPPTVRRYERFEAAFKLDRIYTNPFDPDVVDVRATITTPSGRTLTVFGFWYQDYTRRIIGRREELMPVGDPSWRVRFAPSELGVHTYTLTVRDGGGERTAKPRRFEVLEGPSDGFLRVSKTDYHYLEFDSGAPWWGIGVNLHGTYDYRYNTMVQGRERILEMDRYSLFFDDRLKKCAENGMNWTEMWIASWGFEIEWRGDWRGWAGTGHYNLENAWRLDRALAQCRDWDIYVNLVLSCHGVYSMVKGDELTFDDSEFQHHAYAKRNGGWLTNGAQIMTDERAHEAMRKRLRYLIARYGDSTNIACWEMISESDLVTGGRSAVLPWVFKMAKMVRDMDPYAHPVTNHYCGNYFHVDANCARDPRMDLIAGDAYRGGNRQRGLDGTHYSMYFEPMAENVAKAAAYFDQYKKPAIITECGGQWFAGPKPLLMADVHALNWSAWMTTLPATPLTWWEDLVDEYDLYGDYAAMAKYAAGEDKRNRDLKTSENPAVDADGKKIAHLATMAFKNRTEGYAWIYDKLFYEFGTTIVGYNVHRGENDYYSVYKVERKHEARRFDKACAVLDGLDDGAFDVEIWDCTTGEIISRSELETSGGRLTVALPAFSRDIALKYRKRLY